VRFDGAAYVDVDQDVAILGFAAKAGGEVRYLSGHGVLETPLVPNCAERRVAVGDADSEPEFRLLARCPDGVTEALLLGYGFSISFLAEVVADGYATASESTMRAGRQPVAVVRVKITPAGRRAVEG
jgi:hypothetical protein